MNAVPISATIKRGRLLRPILVGGAVAGSLDLIAAFITYGRNVPCVIAAGLLGRQAIHGGTGIWILGVFLQYFIAFGAATVYCLSSRWLWILKEHFLVCGMFFGIAVYLVMNLIVLPLSALHAAGPYQLHGLIQGLLVHMFIIGLPISYSLRRFGN
jgi:hypothetical protein